MPLLFAHPLFARQNPLEEAKNTLSSWDNCMDKAYCKCVEPTGLRLWALSPYSHARQMASHCRNHHRRPYPHLGGYLYCAMYMLRSRVRMLLL